MDKQKVLEHKQMLDEYDFSKSTEGNYASTSIGYTIVTKDIRKWLDEQIEPYYPCPVCGEEMSTRWQ